ncbi:MAG: KamA family radical SAM protein [Chlamydiia bacterium]|nr:KamA family radical SAM protein [Chlamydiia bacterium]
MLQWRSIQKESFTTLQDLGKFLEIDLSYTSSFPLNLPRRLAEKIEKGTLDDPILKQFLPTDEEDKAPLAFVDDPVSDISFQKTPRLLQKYQGRALLLATSACAMHCRYCFRQNYPYDAPTDFSKELEIIRRDASLHEVILSGGDPLSLSDETLRKLITGLGDIPHLKLLRFHTRFPIGIPERITEGFLDILSDSPLQTIFVIHVNHPRELDSDIFAALKKIATLGIPLLCQAVLLSGVNDDLAVLKELFLTLSSHGILPYYLHQLDKVRQAHHFEVPVEKGLALMEALRKELPGYALPTYVQEIPNLPSKTPLQFISNIR